MDNPIVNKQQLPETVVISHEKVLHFVACLYAPGFVNYNQGLNR